MARGQLTPERQPTIRGLDAFLHAYAREALADGGIDSPTWLSMLTPMGYFNCMAGLPQGQTHRLQLLYRIYGQGQALRGWSDMPGGWVRRMARAGTLGDADDLPEALRYAPIYRAWWLHHGLPIVKTGHGLRNQPTEKNVPPGRAASHLDNPKLRGFVFPGLGP